MKFNAKEITKLALVAASMLCDTGGFSPVFWQAGRFSGADKWKP